MTFSNNFWNNFGDSCKLHACSYGISKHIYTYMYNFVILVLVKVTKREYSPKNVWQSWQWRSINDEFLNGAFFQESGAELKNRPFSRKDMMTARPGSYVRRLTRYAGNLKCRVGKPCQLAIGATINILGKGQKEEKLRERLVGVCVQHNLPISSFSFCFFFSLHRKLRNTQFFLNLECLKSTRNEVLNCSANDFFFQFFQAFLAYFCQFSLYYYSNEYIFTI